MDERRRHASPDEDGGEPLELSPSGAPRHEDQQPDEWDAPRDVNATWHEYDHRQSRQFGTRELLAATAIGAVVLGAAQLMRPAIAAAVVGLLVLVGVPLLTSEDRGALSHVVWWVLLVVYVVLAARAALFA